MKNEPYFFRVIIIYIPLAVQDGRFNLHEYRKILILFLTTGFKILVEMWGGWHTI